MKTVPALILVFSITALSAFAEPAAPGSFLTAPFGPGGTWNLYQTSTEPLTWADAQELAEKTVDPRGGTGKKGHLVVPSTAPENMFVYQYAKGTYLWIGLTDHERWGGKEAGANRAGGWHWVNGEPYTWSAWHGNEPNETPDSPEDAVAVSLSGRWADWGIGIDGQTKPKFPFMIEWDTQLPQPPAQPDVQKTGRVLPEKWPVDLAAWKGAVTGSGPWTSFGLSKLDGSNLRTAAEALRASMEKEIKVSRVARLNYRAPNRQPRPGGWVGRIRLDTPAHPVSESGCASLHVARVHLDKPARWSFNLHADDYFAIRLPGLKWKSVSGMGGLDPLDPETLYFDSKCTDGHSIGVIDIPAGDHTVEVVSGSAMKETMLQVLAAEGEFTLDGDTETWQFPGFKDQGELAWPGVGDSGWKVTRINRMPGAKRLVMFEEALFLADKGEPALTGNFDTLNFIDSGAEGDVLFPRPVSFPGDQPENQDGFVIKAEAELVIPKDGTYHFGIHADEHCGLCIDGKKWSAIVRDTGSHARLNEDTLSEDAPIEGGTNTQIVGEIPLEKGTCKIEVVYADMVGPSVMSVFAAPAGFAPKLLSKGGAKITPNIPGLPLVEEAKEVKEAK